MIAIRSDKLLSVRAVAVRFGVTTKTVYCWMNGVGGRSLEAVRVGGRLVTSEEALERFAQPKIEQQQSYYTPAEHADLKARYAEHGINID